MSDILSIFFLLICCILFYMRIRFLIVNHLYYKRARILKKQTARLINISKISINYFYMV